MWLGKQNYNDHNFAKHFCEVVAVFSGILACHSCYSSGDALPVDSSVWMDIKYSRYALEIRPPTNQRRHNSHNRLFLLGATGT